MSCYDNNCDHTGNCMQKILVDGETTQVVPNLANQTLSVEINPTPPVGTNYIYGGNSTGKKLQLFYSTYYEGDELSSAVVEAPFGGTLSSNPDLIATFNKIEEIRVEQGWDTSDIKYDIEFDFSNTRFDLFNNAGSLLSQHEPTTKLNTRLNPYTWPEVLTWLSTNGSRLDIFNKLLEAPELSEVDEQDPDNPVKDVGFVITLISQGDATNYSIDFKTRNEKPATGDYMGLTDPATGNYNFVFRMRIKFYIVK